MAGAKQICELLKQNQTLEFLDIGHNRIRQKGLEYITDGLVQAKNSSLKTLGLRMNFINDFGFTTLFNDLIFSGTCSLENLYINLNNLSQFKARKLNEKLRSLNSTLFVDSFEKILYQNDDEKVSKTIWISRLQPQSFLPPRMQRVLRSQII